jgi:hypothetical protein
MIPLRKSFYLRIIAAALVCLFLFQAEAVLALTRGEILARQFKKAIDEYKKNNFVDAAARLERLTAFYENIITDPKEDKIKKGYGQTLLLLAACRERLLLLEMSRQTYLAAKKVLGNKLEISGFKLKKLQIYSEVKKMKAGAEAPANTPSPGTITGKTDTGKKEK